MGSEANTILDYKVEKHWVVDSAVQLFLLKVDDNVARINHAVIPVVQQEDISRYHFIHDRQKRLLARAFLYDYLAAHFGVIDFELGFDAYKKPSLISAPHIHFSFSYAKGYVLVGIAEGRKIGVDIAYIDPTVAVTEIAEDIMCPEELARFRLFVHGSQDQFLFFFRLFSAKEAIIKAFGTGLYYDVKSINTLSGDSFEYMEERFTYVDAAPWREDYTLGWCGQV